MHSGALDLFQRHAVQHREVRHEFRRAFFDTASTLFDGLFTAEGIAVANAEFFGELCVSAEMTEMSDVARLERRKTLLRPSALGVETLSTHTAAHQDQKQNHGEHGGRMVFRKN